MSKVTKRKHVMKEIQADDFDPPGPNQQIVRILGSRGNNLHEVESAEPIASNECAATANDSPAEIGNEQYLVSMPTKFRKNVWVKRGNFVIVEPIDEGDKVKAEIVRILTPQHIKEFTKDGIWPDKFKTKNSNEAKTVDTDDNYSSGDDDELFKNTNRAHQYIDSEDDDESESDDEEESEVDESDGNESDGKEISSEKENDK